VTVGSAGLDGRAAGGGGATDQRGRGKEAERRAAFDRVLKEIAACLHVFQSMAISRATR